MYLRTLIIVANANGAVLGQTVGPEAFNGGTPTKEVSYSIGRKAQVTYSDMASWVKRSQKPKTGLARTSRTA